jgi:hypothetical protein
VHKPKIFWAHFENWGHRHQIILIFFKIFVHILKIGAQAPNSFNFLEIFQNFGANFENWGISPKLFKIIGKIPNYFGHILKIGIIRPKFFQNS